MHRTELENSSLEAPGITTKCSDFWKVKPEVSNTVDLPQTVVYECKNVLSYYNKNSLELTFAIKYFWAIPPILKCLLDTGTGPDTLLTSF